MILSVITKKDWKPVTTDIKEAYQMSLGKTRSHGKILTAKYRNIFRERRACCLVM